MKSVEVRVQADESMKALFSLSKRPTLDLLNGLFGEHFTMEEAEIIRTSTEFVPADMNVILADWIVQVTQEGQARQFHVEFQTYDQSSMIVRMFEYGWQIAKHAAAKEDDALILRFPRQLVLHLERDDAVEEAISCIVQFPPYDEESKFEYQVPVKKFWNISVEELREQLYALIPFHVFTARKSIGDIQRDRSLPEERRRQLIHRELEKVRDLLESSRNHLLDVHRAGKITDEDLDKMSTVMINLSQYLYRKFVAYYETFFEEVEAVVTHVIDFEALKRGKMEARQEGRIEGQIEQLIDILEARGVEDENVISSVKRQTDLSQLKRWAVLAATAPIEKAVSEICKEQA